MNSSFKRKKKKKKEIIILITKKVQINWNNKIFKEKKESNNNISCHF